MTRCVVDAGAVIELARLSATIPAQHRLLAPTLLRSQTLSMLHEAVARGDLTPAEAHEQRSRIRALPIRLLGDAVLQRRAWEMNADLAQRAEGVVATASLETLLR